MVAAVLTDLAATHVMIVAAAAAAVVVDAVAQVAADVATSVARPIVPDQQINKNAGS